MLFFTKLFIRLSCERVGNDEFGNEYFQNKRNQRFVVYKGIVEPSKIPAEWHGWIHHTNNTPPLINTNKNSWQKIHLPNLTGTKNSHSPKNSLAPRTSSVHQSWVPDNS